MEAELREPYGAGFRPRLSLGTVLGGLKPPAHDLRDSILGIEAHVLDFVFSFAYQISFSPNCRLRGSPAPVIRPKLLVPTTLPGIPKRGVLVK